MESGLRVHAGEGKTSTLDPFFMLGKKYNSETCVSSKFLLPKYTNQIILSYQRINTTSGGGFFLPYT